MAAIAHAEGEPAGCLEFCTSEGSNLTKVLDGYGKTGVRLTPASLDCSDDEQISVLIQQIKEAEERLVALREDYDGRQARVRELRTEKHEARNAYTLLLNTCDSEVEVLPSSGSDIEKSCAIRTSAS